MITQRSITLKNIVHKFSWLKMTFNKSCQKSTLTIYLLTEMNGTRLFSSLTSTFSGKFLLFFHEPGGMGPFLSKDGRKKEVRILPSTFREQQQLINSNLSERSPLLAQQQQLSSSSSWLTNSPVCQWLTCEWQRKNMTNFWLCLICQSRKQNRHLWPIFQELLCDNQRINQKFVSKNISTFLWRIEIFMSLSSNCDRTFKNFIPKIYTRYVCKKILYTLRSKWS